MKPRQVFPLLFVAALGAAGLAAPVQGGAAAPQFSFTVLNNASENGFSYVLDLNNRGQSAGYGSVPGDPGGPPENHGLFWRGTNPLDLPPLEGDSSFARGLNDSGLVVGSFSRPVGEKETRSQACFWRNGHPTGLSTPPGEFSIATGVNAGGTICGYSGTETPPGAPPDYHACTWSKGRRSRLPTPGNVASHCDAINNGGDVVGSFNTGQLDQFGFPIFDGCKWKNRRFRRLRALRNTRAHPRAINNRGDAVGSCQGLPQGTTYPSPVATRWHNDGVSALKTLGGTAGYANDINDRGDVIGASDTGRGPGGGLEYHPFLLKGNVIFDLWEALPPASGLHLEQALAINNKGQIAGMARDAKGQQRTVLLTPK